MTTVTVKNGVDVGKLVETIDAIKDDSGLAQFTFRARTEWRDGTHACAEIGGFEHAGREDESRERAFTLLGDEPPALLGENRGPNAVELLLASLGFCYSVGFAANAAARGIDVTEMEYELEGDLDLRNFLGLQDGPRAGFTEIRVRSRVKADGANEDELKELCRYVQDTSPVKDMLVNSVPVDTTIELVS